MQDTRTRRARFVALATLVLLVAMSGSATAARVITGKQIKNGTVTGRDIRNGSVTGVDVRDGSLSDADFAGSLTGPEGPAGPPGPPGAPGLPGSNGVSGLEYRVAEMTVPQNQSAQQAAMCTPDKTVVGGGVSSTAPSSSRVLESAPLNGGVGWTAEMLNVGNGSVTAYVWAVCVLAS